MTKAQCSRTLTFVVMTILVVLMNGCAIGTRNVMLNPVSVNRVADLKGHNVYIEVNDKRNPALKPVVGHVKNGYGMKTAEVVANKQVTAWVKESIENELKRNGSVLESTASDNTTSVSKLIVDVLVCYAQAYARYGAEVKANVSVNRGGIEVMKDKEYSGKAILGMNWGMTASSYQKVLELAMKDFLEKLMPDLERSI